ncbi:MAG TPA: TIGR03936 family radical SAM-associated protein [Spirochaetota bacterium]|nr:TIGR03936 family radical SAM-associated protein [Spirochaetota bacterium]
MTNLKIEEMLLRVEKPARYAGGELFASLKKDADVRIALSYPDLYEIGMANHGIKILYDVANGIDGVACERVFAAYPDFRKELESAGLKLFTIESRTPLSECDCVAFNLSHELLYTNVLQILDLGGIPLRAADRSDGDPIVIAGGEAVSNPAPMSMFIDLFFAGEGEEGFAEIASTLRESKKMGLNRERTIERLSAIEGVFRYGSDMKAVRRVYRGPLMDPVRPVMPSMRISQDRALVEVMRGCFNLCKFCHAGYYNLPCRQYNVKDIAARAKEVIKNTGYNEITFLSLSISDYRDIVPLLNETLPEFNERGISVSLPSLKVDLRTMPIIEVTSDVRKSSVTFAIEAASDEIRYAIHKKLSIDELMEIIGHVFAGKWDTIKLYFMIGLPGFREQDEAASIVELLKKIDDAGRRRKKINATVSPFIPKPHTPFEREEMAGEEYIRETVRRIKTGLPRRIAVKNHSIEGSILEGLLARGDAAVGNVIEAAYRNGATLDSWEEHVRYDLWKSVIAETIGDSSAYYRARGVETALPWDILTTGYDRLSTVMKNRTAADKSKDVPYKEELKREEISGGYEKFKKRFEVKKKYRFVFEKMGRAKYLSHLDFIECVKRGLRILDAPVSYSQGFNKHERIGAGYPISLGIESRSEIMDVDMFDDFSFDASVDQTSVFPEGIRIASFKEMIEPSSIMSITSAIRYEIHAEDNIVSRIAENYPVTDVLHKKMKDGSVKDISAKDAILRFERKQDYIEIVVPASGGIKVDALTGQLAGISDVHSNTRIVKNGQMRLVPNGEYEVIE